MLPGSRQERAELVCASIPGRPVSLGCESVAAGRDTYSDTSGKTRYWGLGRYGELCQDEAVLGKRRRRDDIDARMGAAGHLSIYLMYPFLVLLAPSPSQQLPSGRLPSSASRKQQKRPSRHSTVRAARRTTKPGRASGPTPCRRGSAASGQAEGGPLERSNGRPRRALAKPPHWWLAQRAEEPEPASVALPALVVAYKCGKIPHGRADMRPFCLPIRSLLAAARGHSAQSPSCRRYSLCLPAHGSA